MVEAECQPHQAVEQQTHDHRVPEQPIGRQRHGELSAYSPQRQEKVSQSRLVKKKVIVTS